MDLSDDGARRVVTRFAPHGRLAALTFNYDKSLACGTGPIVLSRLRAVSP
jgi:hypothetical protein